MTRFHTTLALLPHLTTFLVFVLPWRILYRIWALWSPSHPSKPLQLKILDPYGSIKPLTEVHWQSIEPLKIRPFKKQYHLTMGLESSTFSELVAIDKTYLDRVRLRRKLMDEQPNSTLACNDACAAAVLEFYEWLFGVYLPQRFPMIFQRISPSTTEKHSPVTRNLVTDEMITIKDTDATTALREIGNHIDTDFLFLLPLSVSRKGQPVYHLEAFVTCFPSGFSTPSKLGMPLAEIHKPVPGYAAKLERSMDRFFARIEVGTIVKRANWTVTTTDDLFIEAGTHSYRGEDEIEDLEKQRHDVVIEGCRLRAERQTLHRLAKTKALVFAFKTYQYRLEDIKAEGDGPALADAIEGLADGSVPEMKIYKRGVVWGDMVIGFLRDRVS